MLFIQIDQQIQHVVASLQGSILDVIAHFLEITGDNILLYCTVILLLLCVKKTRKYAVYLGITIVIAIFITTLIKYSVNRPRPFVEQNLADILKSVNQRDYYLSFPSGHTTAIAVVASTYWLYYRKHAVYCIFAVMLMAWSRMYLYMHYPIDTIAGACIGLMTAYLVMEGSKRLEKLKTDKIKRSV